MRWFLVVLGLVGLTSVLTAGGLGDPVPEVKYVELAGTLVVESDGTFILKSNGHEFVLSVKADEPGVASLKSGTALIVKGMVTIVKGADSVTSRTLRPDEMIIRGHSYLYSDTAAP